MLERLDQGQGRRWRAGSMSAVRLGQRLGFGCGLFQNVRRHFPDSQMEFKHGRCCAATPPAYLPVRTNEFRLSVRSQVEQQGVLAPVKLLGEGDERLRAPGSAIGGAVN